MSLIKFFVRFSILNWIDSSRELNNNKSFIDKICFVGLSSSNWCKTKPKKQGQFKTCFTVELKGKKLLTKDKIKISLKILMSASCENCHFLNVIKNLLLKEPIWPLFYLQSWYSPWKTILFSSWLSIAV